MRCCEFFLWERGPATSARNSRVDVGWMHAIYGVDVYSSCRVYSVSS